MGNITSGHDRRRNKWALIIVPYKAQLILRTENQAQQFNAKRVRSETVKRFVATETVGQNQTGIR
jgi:hypothetical protein